MRRSQDEEKPGEERGSHVKKGSQEKRGTR